MSGRKRHLPVDTLGLVRGRAALPASPTDWDGAADVSRRVGKTVPRSATVWADSADRVAARTDWVRANTGGGIELVTRRGGAAGFGVQPWRWVVERTFGWLGRYRRLAKGDEHNPKSSEAWIDITAIPRMSGWMLPDRNRDDDLLKRPRKRRKPKS